MENRKNLCAMIPEELHKRLRAEQEQMGLKLADYVERILKEHFEKEKGGKDMEQGTRTLAFQVTEELFGRVKQYLAKHPGLSQKDFVIGLIVKALDEAEQEAAETESEAEEPEAQADGEPEEPETAGLETEESETEEPAAEEPEPEEPEAGEPKTEKTETGQEVTSEKE